jgi:hypothetical protein
MVFEYCAMVIAVSLTSVVGAGSIAIVLGIIMTILGRDAD